MHEFASADIPLCPITMEASLDAVNINRSEAREADTYI